MAPKGVERELTTVLGEGSSGRRDIKKCVVGLEITVLPRLRTHSSLRTGHWAGAPVFKVHEKFVF